MEGFDVSRVQAALERIYTGSQTSGVPTILTPENPAQDRGIAGAGAIHDSAVSDDGAILHTPTLVSPAQNTWIIGFAFRSDHGTNLVTGTTAPYVALHNTDGEQIRIEVYEYTPADTKPGGLYYGWRVMRGATEIARTNEVFDLWDISDLSWVHFEFKVTIDNATGSIEGRFRYYKSARNATGGFQTFTWDSSVTNVDTQNQTSTGADSFVLSFTTGTATNNCAFDNVYVMDSTGLKNNDFLGKGFITPMKITTTGGGAGSTTDWDLATATDTEDAWQEPPTSVEDDDRLTSDTVGQIHLAQMGLSGTLDFMDNASIIGVRMDLYGRMETTGDLDIGFMWRKTTGTPAQTQFGTALNVDSTTMEAASVIAEDDPNTTTDWVLTDLQSYQLGAVNNG
jgi:hypothetical protein